MPEPRTLPLSRLRRLIDLPGDAPVRIHTLQSAEGIAAARDRGFLSGDRDSIETDWFLPAYEWMRNRMAERIPDFSGDLPVWAWARRPVVRRRRDPSLRETRTRLTAMVPRRRILVSCFHDWHDCLNGMPITHGEEEWNAYEKAFPISDRCEEHRLYVQGTWTRVFDLHLPRDAAMIEWRGSNLRVTPQLCVDRLYLDEVIAMRSYP